MIVHEVFAHIYEGEVKNIIVCDNYPTADYLAKCIYGSDAFAVDCLQYECAIGDKYHDGAFFSVDSETGEEKQVQYRPTEAQEIEQLKSDYNQIVLALADLYGGV